MDKKEIESKITELVKDYEKETGLEISYIDIEKKTRVGFNTINSTLAKIKIKN